MDVFLSLNQGGGIDSLEKEVKKMGRKVWKQFAFQMTNSTLKYFSRIDRVCHIFLQHSASHNILLLILSLISETRR